MLHVANPGGAATPLAEEEEGDVSGAVNDVANELVVADARYDKAETRRTLVDLLESALAKAAAAVQPVVLDCIKDLITDVNINVTIIGKDRVRFRPIHRMYLGLTGLITEYPGLVRAHFERRWREDQLRAQGLPVPDDKAVAGGLLAAPTAEGGGSLNAIDATTADAMASQVLALVAGGDDLVGEDDDLMEFEVTDDDVADDDDGLDDDEEEAERLRAVQDMVDGLVEAFSEAEGVTAEVAAILMPHRFRPPPQPLPLPLDVTHLAVVTANIENLFTHLRAAGFWDSTQSWSASGQV